MRKAGLRDFTWHDLRHTFAARLVMSDVDIRTVAELMGHKSIQMTMRYAHLASSSQSTSSLPSNDWPDILRKVRSEAYGCQRSNIDSEKWSCSIWQVQPAPQPTPRKQPLRKLLMGL